jgi:hypothetical protein
MAPTGPEEIEGLIQVVRRKASEKFAPDPDRAQTEIVLQHRKHCSGDGDDRIRGGVVEVAAVADDELQVPDLHRPGVNESVTNSAHRERLVNDETRRTPSI